MAKALLIEDENYWQRTITKLLEREGHDVTLAHDFDKAQHILSSEKADDRAFAIIITDLRLVKWGDDFEGLSLLPLIDERVKTDNSKVIVVTAYGKDQQARVAWRDHEIFEWIPKADPEVDFHDEFLDAIKKAFLEYNDEYYM